MSQIGILNVGAGDTKLTFDKDDPAECIRAARIVSDMLRRGYSLLVRLEDGKYRRVHKFDDTKFEYIIADFDPLIAIEADAAEAEKVAQHEEAVEAAESRPGEEKSQKVGRSVRGKRKADRVIDARDPTVKAVAIGPRAGG